MVPNGSFGTLLSGPMRTNCPTVFVMGDINLNQFLISLFMSTVYSNHMFFLPQQLHLRPPEF